MTSRVRGTSRRLQPTRRFIVLGALLTSVLLAPSVKADETAGMTPEQRRHYDEAAQHLQVAKKHLDAEEYDQALPILEREVLPRLERAYGPDHKMVQDFKRTIEGIRSRVQKSSGASSGGGDADGMAKMVALMQDVMSAMSAGDFERAIPLAEKLLPLVEQEMGPESEQTLILLRALTKMYDATNRFKQSEALYMRAIEIVKKQHGAESEQMIQWFKELAAHYTVRGDYAKTFEILSAATNVARRVKPGSKLLVETLLSEVQMRRSAGMLNEASQLAEEALSVAENLSPPDEPLLAEALAQLAKVRLSQGKPAGDLLKRSMELAKKTGDQSALRTARDAYVEWLQQEGRLSEAEPLIEERVQETAATFGAQSFQVAIIEQDLAALRWASGRHEPALQLFEKIAEAWETGLRHALVAGNEAQKRAFSRQLGIIQHDILAVNVLAPAPLRPRATRLGLTSVLRWKGRTLDTISESMRLARAATDPEQKAVLEQLQTVRGQLASLTLRGPTKEVPQASYQSKLNELERRANDLERQLVELNPSLGSEAEGVDIEAVQREIPEDAALVDFAVYVDRVVDTKQGVLTARGMHAVAYVLRHTGEPVLVDLGDAKRIEAAVAKLRKALASPTSQDAKQLGRTLDELVMRPIRPHLGNVEHVLLAPDHVLNLVPFAALVDERDQYLIEKYLFTYLSSGRDLVRLANRREPREAALLLGDPAFDETTTSSAGSSGSQRSGDLARAKFTPLPGTAQEVKAIGEVLPNTRAFVQGAATEDVLSDVHGPVILHVATHGFFLKEEDRQATGSSRALSLDTDGEVKLKPPQTENPLLRSGIALTGANVRGGSNPDGIVTALEMSALDLDGTELVVLSACETGVGEVQYGEGVYGLRRALVIAGARSQVMSLWKVDDDATRDLMVGFYEGLKDGQGRSEAMRNAQRTLMSNNATAHPYFWASFIPSGDWRPMSVESAQATGSTASDDEDDETPILLGGGGIRFGLGANLFTVEQFSTHPKRDSISAALEMSTSLLGLLSRGSGVGFRDRGSLRLMFGQLQSDPIVVPGRTEEEGKSAFGYELSYWAAIGYRAESGWGLFAGPGFTYLRRELGDTVVSGSTIPIVAELGLPYVTLRGWTGEIAGSGSSEGAGATVSLPFIARSLTLTGSYERLALPMRRPNPARLGVSGDAEATSITIILGISSL